MLAVDREIIALLDVVRELRCSLVLAVELGVPVVMAGVSVEEVPDKVFDSRGVTISLVVTEA